MASEFEWFPCKPTPLLATLAGMKAPKKLVYLMMLLRIYECGGGCPDTIDAIAMRVGFNKRIVSDALDELFREGRLVRGEGGIRNPVADVVIADSKALRERRIGSATEAANRRWQKSKQNQQTGDAKRNAPAMRNDANLQEQEQDSLFTDVNRVPPPPKPKPEPKPKAAKPTELVDDGWPADHLEQFWSNFPPYRRESKGKVAEKLARIRAAGKVPWHVLIAGVMRYSLSNPGEYACAPMVWLNGEKWDRVFGSGNSNGGTSNAANREKLGFAGIAARGRAARRARAGDQAPFTDAGGGEPGNRSSYPAHGVVGVDGVRQTALPAPYIVR